MRVRRRSAMLLPQDRGRPESGAPNPWGWSMMRRGAARYAISLLLWLPLSIAPGLQTHRPQANPVTIQTLPASPSVLATVANRGERLELLVLWRGSPGWFALPSQRRASYSETDGVLSAALAYGGLDLRLSFDPAGRTATIQDTRVPLQPDANVLLVDDVDGPKGPRLVRALSVPSGGSSADPSFGTLAPFVKRSEEVVAFLRCDVGTASKESDQMVRRILCDDLGTRPR